MIVTSELAPTLRQLSYLRALAAKTASTFTTPATRSQASSEIDRLRLMDPVPRAEPVDHERESLHYATAVSAEEVSGFGSTATWRSSPPVKRQEGGRRGEGRLASYETPDGARVLVGKRVLGGIHVTDVPRDGNGRSYVVETAVELSGLDALIDDYIAQAKLLGEVPMGGASVRELLTVGADV